MGTTGDDQQQGQSGSVRLVYHYRDGHDFTTETMLRTQAIAYMPVLQAVAVDAEHYEAAFAAIELLSARDRSPRSQVSRLRAGRHSGA